MSDAEITGRFENFNAQAQAAATRALMTIGRYLVGKGPVDGTLKMEVEGEGRTFTASLENIDDGVKRSGDLVRTDVGKFRFISSFDGVDEKELLHLMLHAIDDMAVFYTVDGKEGLDLDDEGHHHHDEGHHHHHDEGHHHHHDGEHAPVEDSMEEVGGVAVGITGTLPIFDDRIEDRFSDALVKVGTFVQGSTGCLLGHIKASITSQDGNGITLNLIDMDNGVEHHGHMDPCKDAKFIFMCAVLDVESDSLRREMVDAVMTSGLRAEIDAEEPHHHHHHHDE